MEKGGKKEMDGSVRNKKMFSYSFWVGLGTQGLEKEFRARFARLSSLLFLSL